MEIAGGSLNQLPGGMQQNAIHARNPKGPVKVCPLRSEPH